MPEHGDAYLELQLAVLKALPRDIDDVLARRWANNFDVLSEGLRSLLFSLKPDDIEALVPQLAMVPSVGVTFQLTLKVVISGLDFADLIHEKTAKGWNYKGEEMTGALTRWFKLVAVGNCDKLKDVRGKLQAHGEIPQGQWLQAFRQTYMSNDAKSLIGIADPSWIDPDGDIRFPQLQHSIEGWKPSFKHANGLLGSQWRWLVEVK